MNGEALPAPTSSASADWLEYLPGCVGEVRIERRDDGSFAFSHRDDVRREGLEVYRDAEAAMELVRFDDEGRYRPLKTAPNLRHGWLLVVDKHEYARLALEYFYPGRAVAYRVWRAGEMRMTPLRETLARQTGMYRVAASIGEQEADALVGNFCRSDGGCLRTILWKRDALGALPSHLLPEAKYEPAFDQTGRGERAWPLLCQEACNLLVAAAREVVKAKK